MRSEFLLVEMMRQEGGGGDRRVGQTEFRNGWYLLYLLVQEQKRTTSTEQDLTGPDLTGPINNRTMCMYR